MSINRDKWEEEAKKELAELEEIKINYGWTVKDAERYYYLLKELKEEQK